ncbi:DUF1572 family protein [Salmonirosea aquatica]|uniref:DUF1572 domain-containing protein n=1 Tax=Salmonirosea aquatica TaxID=2654236 RepID=A0A7C9BHR2_9BACT|nr:DUF1572 domain-containing protein [Cytophagaceae bacterium SJW1-29]
MLIDTLKTLFSRDLAKLKSEIEQYQQEEKIWYVEKNIANSAGNLCLHLVGNLNTFIGADFGATGYIRDRDLEFSAKNVPRPELIQQITETAKIVDTTLGQLTAEQLQAECPVQRFEQKVSTEYLLVHLAMHLSYHLGQVNYHRRLLDE